MLKKYKFTIVLTAIVCLLPMLAGLLLWNKLPDPMPSHWDINGNVDGWSSKPFAVFFFPGLLAAVHLLCAFAVSMDPKSKNYTDKMFLLVLWLCPVLSLIMNALVYCVALGYDFLNIGLIMSILVGLMFLIVGNYLPKCKQSYTMGIKLPWTLDNEANWNATHRFGGWVWTLCGVTMLATAFLANFWILLGIILVAVAAPTIYSYLYYRKHKND